MNYMTEIKLFYTWIETHSLGSNEIALWHGLMFIANCSGWVMDLNIPISMLESRTGLSRSSLFRARSNLCRIGLIEYKSRGGRLSATYTLRSFELHFASQIETQNVTQDDLESHFVSQFASQIGTIYKLNYTDNKENNKKKNLEVADESAPVSTTPQKKKEKSSGQKERKRGVLFDPSSYLETLDPPWREVMQQWLEYKRTRKESYRSEMGVRKCLTMLQNLSGGNPQIAEQIVDKSIANNWAGLFELKQSHYPARGQPATGQHIGQIMQPKDDEHRRKILEKFGKPKK